MRIYTIAMWDVKQNSGNILQPGGWRHLDTGSDVVLRISASIAAEQRPPPESEAGIMPGRAITRAGVISQEIAGLASTPIQASPSAASSASIAANDTNARPTSPQVAPQLLSI